MSTNEALVAASNPEVRHDAVLIFDVTDSNPNGDPDAGNQPRTDPETGQGLVTDVSIKRKVRDTIAIQPELDGTDHFGIYVTAGTALNTQQNKAYEALNLEISNKPTPDQIAAAQAWMTEHYFDVRMFGAVMSTGKSNAGRVTGPVQVGMARSVDPVVLNQLAITRVTKTQEGKEDQSEMGSKWVIPYGVYVARIHYSPTLGAKTGVNEQDLRLLWQSLEMMWDHTRSAARPDIATRALLVFNHDSALGNAPASALVGSVSVSKNEGVSVPRRWTDYSLDLPDELPAGVSLSRLVLGQ